jgi:hypothetical protein
MLAIGYLAKQMILRPGIARSHPQAWRSRPR